MSKAKPIEAVDVKDFIKRRDEMLEKRSVEALVEFVKTDPSYDSDPIREAFLRQTPLMQELTLCKMILNVGRISRGTREWAKRRRVEILSAMYGVGEA